MQSAYPSSLSKNGQFPWKLGQGMVENKDSKPNIVPEAIIHDALRNG